MYFMYLVKEPQNSPGGGDLTPRLILYFCTFHTHNTLHATVVSGRQIPRSGHRV